MFTFQSVSAAGGWSFAQARIFSAAFAAFLCALAVKGF